MTIELVLISILMGPLKDEWGADRNKLGYLPTAGSFGSFVGGIVWSYISDVWGRRLPFLGTSLFISCLGILCAFAPSLDWLIVLRFFLGLGIGGSINIDFVMFVEFVPEIHRKTLPSLLILFSIGGVTATALIGWATIPVYGWRTFLFVSALPNVLILIGRLFWQYESPRFLVAQNRCKEAREVLVSIARINRQFSNIPLISPLPAAAPTGFSSLKSHVPLLATFFWLWFAIAFGYYGWTIWLNEYLTRKGLSGISIYQNLLLISIIELPGLALVSFLMQRIGRSKALAVSLTGCSISTLLFGLANSKIWVIVLSCFVYFWTVGAWTVIYIFTPESFHSGHRNLAFSLSTIGSTVGGMIVGPIGGLMFDINLDLWYILIVFASVFISGAAVSFFCAPDTSQHHLDEDLTGEVVAVPL